MSRDAFRLTIDARELPAGCKPPYRGQTVWRGEHRSFRIVVTRIQGDPLPHVVAHGQDPATGRWLAHAERLAGATARSVRDWLDALLLAGLPEPDVRLQPDQGRVGQLR